MSLKKLVWASGILCPNTGHRNASRTPDPKQGNEEPYRTPFQVHKSPHVVLRASQVADRHTIVYRIERHGGTSGLRPVRLLQATQVQPTTVDHECDYDRYYAGWGQLELQRRQQQHNHAVSMLQCRTIRLSCKLHKDSHVRCSVANKGFTTSCTTAHRVCVGTRSSRLPVWCLEAHRLTYPVGKPCRALADEKTDLMVLTVLEPHMPKA